MIRILAPSPLLFDIFTCLIGWLTGRYLAVFQSVEHHPSLRRISNENDMTFEIQRCKIGGSILHKCIRKQCRATFWMPFKSLIAPKVMLHIIFRLLVTRKLGCQNMCMDDGEVDRRYNLSLLPLFIFIFIYLFFVCVFGVYRWFFIAGLFLISSISADSGRMTASNQMALMDPITSALLPFDRSASSYIFSFHFLVFTDDLFCRVPWSFHIWSRLFSEILKVNAV